MVFLLCSSFVHQFLDPDVWGQGVLGCTWIMNDGNLESNDLASAVVCG